MKNLKFVLLVFILTLSISLLLSCGNNAADPHPEGCTCEECLAEKNDTGITHKLFHSDYTALLELSQVCIADAEDLGWLIDYVSGCEGVDDGAREELLSYLGELPEDFLDNSFLILAHFDPEMIVEGSFRVVQDGVNLSALFTLKEEYNASDDRIEEAMGERGLVVIEADRLLYHRRITLHIDYTNAKMADTAFIPLNGKANPELFGTSVEHEMLSMVLFFESENTGFRGKEDYFIDISDTEAWGFSPIIGSEAELAVMLEAFDSSLSAASVLSSIGISDLIFEDMVLIPFAARALELEEHPYNLSVSYCRVSSDGVLEIGVEPSVDLAPESDQSFDEDDYFIILAYVVVRRDVLEGVTGIKETLLQFK